MCYVVFVLYSINIPELSKLLPKPAIPFIISQMTTIIILHRELMLYYIVR